MTDDHTAIKPNKELEEKQVIKIMNIIGVDDKNSAIIKLYENLINSNIDKG